MKYLLVLLLFILTACGQNQGMTATEIANRDEYCMKQGAKEIMLVQDWNDRFSFKRVAVVTDVKCVFRTTSKEGFYVTDSASH